MPVSLRNTPADTFAADAVVVGLLRGKKKPSVAPGGEAVAEAYGRKWAKLIASLGATGKAGELHAVPTLGVLKAKTLVLVGLGSEADAPVLRTAAAASARAAKGEVAFALPADSPARLAAVVEGQALGSYAYDAYKSSGPAAEKATTVLTPLAKKRAGTEAANRARIVAGAVCRARDWVNTPPADLRPPAFADLIAEVAATVPGVSVRIHDEGSLAELGCGGILAVGAGSSAPPRLVELAYAPEGATRHLALVGKGITFDSGGLTIKPGGSMGTMKSDMAGAAAVVNATLAIAELGLPVRVSAFAPLAENMPSGGALRPGDVIRHFDGTTTEATNTDAEGRLVLADALGRAVAARPDAIIDVATLTGAMVMSLGDQITGVVGTDEVVAGVLEASREAGEPAWPLPIPAEMDERVHSSAIADLAQVDWVRWGGGLFAAAYLREFTGGLPWAHLDIAGPSFNSGGPRGVVGSGGTGVSVATLVAYASRIN